MRPGSSGEIAVRHVRGDESKLVRTLRLASLRSDPDAFASTHAHAAALPADWWETWAGQSELGTDQRTFVLVLGDGRAVGIALVRRDDETPGSAVINAMWVAPEARGRGGARMLCEACASWAAARGCHRLTLTVVRDNHSARRAYESAGFAIERPTTWSDERRTLHEYLMQREL